MGDEAHRVTQARDIPLVGYVAGFTQKEGEGK